VGLNNTRVPEYIRMGRCGWQLILELLTREESHISVGALSDLYDVNKSTVYRWRSEINSAETQFRITIENGKIKLNCCTDATNCCTDATIYLNQDIKKKSLESLFNSTLEDTQEMKFKPSNDGLDNICTKKDINIKQNRFLLISKYISTTYAHAREVPKFIVYLVVQSWNAAAPKTDLPVHYKKHMERGDTIPQRLSNPIKEVLREYTPKQLIKAIWGFAYVKNSDKTFWSYRFTLKQFLKKKVSLFVDREIGQLIEDFREGGKIRKKRVGSADLGEYE